MSALGNNSPRRHAYIRRATKVRFSSSAQRRACRRARADSLGPNGALAKKRVAPSPTATMPVPWFAQTRRTLWVSDVPGWSTRQVSSWKGIP